MKKIIFILIMMFLSKGLLFSLTGFSETPAFAIDDETLPVTLSSFMAVPNVNNQSIAINWVTQSESNMIGYHILRAETNSLALAFKVTSNIIPATNSLLTSNYNFNDNEAEGQVIYYYWLESVQANKNEFFGPVTAKIENIEDENGIEEIVLGDNLYTNYPNPFNPSTTISYSIAEPSTVTIDIFNIKGQKIKRIFSEYVQDVNEKRSIVWNGDDTAGKQVTSGIYFARIKTASFTKTRKMLLTK